MNKDEKNLIELFGSSARVRILKLFLNNPDERPSLADIVKKTRVPHSQCKRELNGLLRLGLLKTTTYVKEKTNQAPKKKRSSRPLDRARGKQRSLSKIRDKSRQAKNKK